MILGNKTAHTAGMVRVNVASAVGLLSPPGVSAFTSLPSLGFLPACLPVAIPEGTPQRLKHPCHKALQPLPQYQHPPLKWGKIEIIVTKIIKIF